MTVVEFFDESPLKNLISAISLNPEKVIFICVGTVPQKTKDRYKAVAKSIALRTTFEYKEETSTGRLIDVLTDIVMKEETCVFDLTGGDVLACSCMGMVYERYHRKHNIRMHRFCIRTGEAFDAVTGQQILSYPRPRLTIEQVVALYGGKAAGSTSGKEHSDWELNDDFRKALHSMWEVCCPDPASWNDQISKLAECESTRDKSKDDLRAEKPQTRLSVKTLRKRVTDFQLSAKGEESDTEKELKAFLNTLAKKELISFFANSHEWVITYHSQQIRRCLAKEGNLLEAKMLMTFTDMKDHNGDKVFHEAKSSVHIDWDGVFKTGEAGKSDTHNEIDLMMMRGVVPVFVSCKNGIVKEDEVFKFSTVARHFGGDHGGKLLIATFVSHNDDNRQYLENRMEDVGISLVKNIHGYSDEGLRENLLDILL